MHLSDTTAYLTELPTAVQRDSDTRDEQVRAARQTRHDTWAGRAEPG